MIKGRVQLFAKQHCIAIAIHDRALGKISLDHDTALLVESSCCKRENEPKGEPLLSAAASSAGSKRNLDQSQPEHAAGEAAPKRSKVLECNKATPVTRRQQTRYNVKTRFNAKDRKVHIYKTRNVSKTTAAETTAAETKSNSLTSKDVARAEPPLVFSFTADKEASNRADEMRASSGVTRDEQSCAVSARDENGDQVDVFQCPRTTIADPRPPLRDIRVRDPEPPLPPGDPSREDRASSHEKRRNCLLM